MNKHISYLLNQAELNILQFDIHRRNEMSYVDRVFHTHYCMSYNQEGPAKFRVGSQIYHIPPGSVLFIPPNLIHDMYKDTDEESVFLWWHFTYKVMGVIDMLSMFQIPYVAPLRNREHFERVFQSFVTQSKDTTDWLSPILLKAKALELIYILLHDVLRSGEEEQQPRGKAGYMSLLCHFVQHPEKQLSLSTMAEELHVNPAYFSTRFRELFGMSPVHMQHKIRMEKAKSLLTTMADTSITEISERLGFQEIQYFTRMFKKVVGVSPNQYRQMYSKYFE